MERMLLASRVALAWIALLVTTAAFAEPTVKQTMDDVVTRLYATMSEDELYAIDNATSLQFFTPQEREVLATKYWYFDVNVPVVVSVLRTTNQLTVPFWLAEAGFTKTNLTVHNIENWEYEVWQKNFPAGHVGLGINGFDKHREHYLVGVGPQNEGDAVTISDLFPSEFSIETMQDGALCYHDWDNLFLKDVPRSLAGHKLLTTIRGRARDAHLVGGFRKTQWPSSSKPDQIALTWSHDPRTTQAVQWRTSTDVGIGDVRYKVKESKGEYLNAHASIEKIENRLLVNDRYCHHHSALLSELQPDTEYVYAVGSSRTNTWSDEATFTTAPEGPKPFTFVMFGDTHNKVAWGEMLDGAFARHPETAFYTIAGDLVDTGQYRDDWDAFFAHSSNVFRQRPVMPSLGNHDTLDGLGAALYRSVFALPTDGPSTLPPERAYSFEYSNALFVIPDCTSSATDQLAWMEETLANSKAAWKFVVYHFPPYSQDYDEYPGIRFGWGALFDKYHVDFALEGHVHYYMRSHPIHGDKVVGSPKNGTIHLISIAIPGPEREFPPADYAIKQYRGDAMYQTFRIEGNRLEFKAHLSDGSVYDELIIEK